MPAVVTESFLLFAIFSLAGSEVHISGTVACYTKRYGQAKKATVESMKPFNKTIFIIATVVFGLLLIPSFLAAFGKDEGTLSEFILDFICEVFYILRFPTHALLWSIFSNGGAIVFFGGLLANCCFYGLMTERLISIFKA